MSKLFDRYTPRNITFTDRIQLATGIRFTGIQLPDATPQLIIDFLKKKMSKNKINSYLKRHTYSKLQKNT
jgi:hypothetical protein